MILTGHLALELVHCGYLRQAARGARSSWNSAPSLSEGGSIGLAQLADFKESAVL